MLAVFNIGVGVAIAVFAITPLFFIKNRWGRYLVFLGALGCGYVGAQICESMIYPQYLAWRFDSDIKKQPLFALIAKTHPQEFKQYVDKVQQTIREQGDVNVVPALSAQLVNSIFYQHLQHAPDENILLYLKATLDLYHYLNGQEPRAVVKIENDDKTIPVNLNVFWSDKKFQALLNHLLDTKRYVIVTGIETPVASPTSKEAKPLLQGVLNTLNHKYGEKVIQEVFSSQNSVPANVGAQAIIEFYTEILKSGKENAGVLMRHMAHMKAERT